MFNKLLLLIALILLSSFSFAGSFVAKIEKILVYEQDELIYIYPSNGVPNPPACHGANGDYVSFKMDRPMAKEYLSVLMMAFIAQKTVSFRTHGACVDQNLSDTLMYFSVVN